MPTLGHSLLAFPATHATHEIFALPGDFGLPLFKSSEKPTRLPVHTLAPEPAVSAAAARSHGGISAFDRNNNIADAEPVPSIVISGAPGSHRTPIRLERAAARTATHPTRGKHKLTETTLECGQTSDTRAGCKATQTKMPEPTTAAA